MVVEVEMKTGKRDLKFQHRIVFLFVLMVKSVIKTGKNLEGTDKFWDEDILKFSPIILE